MSHQVDSFCRSANEDNLLFRLGSEKPADFLSSCFKRMGRTLAQGMGSAVNVGVVPAVEVGGSVENRLRLVGGCRIVEIDQRVAIYALVKGGTCNGKVCPVKPSSDVPLHIAVAGGAAVGSALGVLAHMATRQGGGGPNKMLNELRSWRK